MNVYDHIEDLELEQALAILDDRERVIITLYYNEGNTLKEIGKRLGLTNERVRQIRNKGLRVLLRRLNSAKPNMFDEFAKDVSVKRAIERFSKKRYL